MVGTPVLFIVIPLLAAFLIPLLGMLWKELVRIVPGLVLAYMLVLSVNLLNHVLIYGPIVEVIAGWRPPLGINLVFSAFSGFLVTLVVFMGLLIWVYSYRFKRNVDFEPAKKYFLLLMMLITGSVGIILTGDIFNMFVFIEITGISGYALTAFYTGRDSAEASFKYLMLGSIASTFLLLAIMIIYSQVGTLNMADIASKMHTIKPVYKIISFIFFITAIGIEAEIFPLNGWAPDAYTEAPGPVGAAFAGIVVKASVYAIVRYVYTIFDLSGAYDFLILIGLITLIMAETAAIRQERLKRMLAYSSIGQMGLVMVAFGMGTEEGVFAALFMILNHAIIKSLLFFSGSYLVYNSKHKYIKEVNGMSKYLPITSLLFALGAFAIVGLPPFAGFWSKLSMLTAAADSNMLFIIALVLIVSVVELVYYLRVVNRIYFFNKEEKTEPKKPTFNALIVMITLGALILVIGFYPDAITGILHKASADLMDKGQYIHDVLSLNK
ncbi:MAG TPA: proton-conducting membrane transporter [Bacteroidetes bacterium]|nr:proton-conducting membrane transporter [Bacteroidota bacterium]